MSSWLENVELYIG